MRRLLGVLAMTALFACAANAQITRTATFENYTPGTAFGSFTDSLSGITFFDSTNPLGSFVIDSDSQDVFDGTNYLTAAGGPNDNFGTAFGFTATLPESSDRVSAFILSFGPPSLIVLSGFDSAGVLVAQESGPSTSSVDPFNIEIDSSQYNIASFQFSGMNRGIGYDNISYTYFPEPQALFALIPVALSLYRRRR